MDDEKQEPTPQEKEPQAEIKPVDIVLVGGCAEAKAEEIFQIRNGLHNS